jgi:ABC-2 type transport system ATP-binding protein
LRASERDAGRLSVALVEAGIGILALVPRTATLEDLFFDLTEGAPSVPPETATVEEHA